MVDGLTSWIQIWIEIIDYFNDSVKTSPISPKCWYREKIAPNLLAAFWDYTFLPRICFSFAPFLDHNWISALDFTSEWSNSVGEMFKFGINLITNLSPEMLIVEKRKICTRSPSLPDSFWTSPALCGFFVTFFGSQVFLALQMSHMSSLRTQFGTSRTEKLNSEQDQLF